MSQLKESSVIKAMLNASGKLVAFVAISIVFLLIVREVTAPTIKAAEKANLLNNFNQVLSTEEYDNDLLTSTTTIEDVDYLKLLGSEQAITVYRAYKNTKPVGAIFTTTANNGYSGDISILVAVHADGRISGVRVLKHKETPGLGDKIDINKSNWVLEFNGRKLRDDNPPRWAVKKDGGDFDQFTGATITPRAVIEAVEKSLLVINDIGVKLYE